MKIYNNGEVVEKESLAGIFEPGFLFGWGLFEALRAYNKNIAFLDKHVERLNNSLDKIGIGKLELDWERTIKQLLDENNLVDAYIRITAYKKRKGIGLIIYVDEFNYYKDDSYQKGFSAIISGEKRDPGSITSQVKSISYLQNRFAWYQAQRESKQEALLLNFNGSFAGASRSNVFFVKSNKLFTPSVACGAFCGITKAKVLGIAKGLKLEVVEGEIFPAEIANFDEAFITSSLMQVMPLVEIDGEPIGSGVPGKLTLKILEKYRRLLK